MATIIAGFVRTTFHVPHTSMGDVTFTKNAGLARRPCHKEYPSMNALMAFEYWIRQASLESQLFTVMVDRGALNEGPSTARLSTGVDFN
jgi:hypothetical protein